MAFKKFLFTAAVVAAAISPASAQEKLSLTIDKAVALGLDNSKILHASLMNVEASDAKSSETNTARLPRIQFGGSYTRLM